MAGDPTISLSPLTVVAVEKRSSLSFIRTMFDLNRQDRIALPLDPAAAFGNPGILITERVAAPAGGGWFAERHAPRHDDAIAQISLTSGTTGAAKAIALSHRALGDVAERLVAAMELDASVSEYVGVPVSYSFGFGRIRAVAAVGGRAFLPEAGFRVDEFAAMLARGEVNALSAVPSLLRVALAQADRLREAGRNLRWLEIGSQAMSRAEKEAVCALFPNARIIQHYGLTEASRTTFLRVSEERGAALESVGRPEGAVEIRITDEGRIAIRGPHVADGIVTANGIEKLTDRDGWLVTGDLGHIEAGRLYFEGRVDDVVNIGGIKVPAEAFEERLLARLSGIEGGAAITSADFACAGGRDDLRGEVMVVAHRLGNSPERLALLRRAAGEVAVAFNVRDGFALLAMEEFPRTETNKIRRLEIGAIHASRRLEPVTAPPSAASEDPGAAVRQEFDLVFLDRISSGEESFADLGGDSLQYVVMLLALEKHIREVPEGWDRWSVNALAALARQQADAGHAKTRARLVPANLNSVRGLACVMIVALHVVGVAADEGLRLPLESMWHTVMDAFTPIRLPLFTALSGFLYAAMPATRDGFRIFAGRKLQQLLLPLIFATLVFWSLRQVIFGRDDSLLWAFIDGYQHLWFIDALLMMFLLVGFVDTLVRGRQAAWWALMAGVCLLYPFFPNIPVLHMKNALFLLPFFIFGLLLYRVPALLRQGWLLGLSLVMLPVLLVLQYVPLGDLAVMDLTLARWLCGAAAAIVFLRLFPRLRWLDWIAVYSFSIYLWHPAANGLVRTLGWEAGVQNVALLFGVGLAAGILLPILLHEIMLRMPRLSAFVIGR